MAKKKHDTELDDTRTSDELVREVDPSEPDAVDDEFTRMNAAAADEITERATIAVTDEEPRTAEPRAPTQITEREGVEIAISNAKHYARTALEVLDRHQQGDPRWSEVARNHLHEFERAMDKRHAGHPFG